MQLEDTTQWKANANSIEFRAENYPETPENLFLSKFSYQRKAENCKVNFWRIPTWQREWLK